MTPTPTAGGTLPQRYGAPPAWQRRTLIGVVGVLVLAFAAWLTWTIVVHSTPAVHSEMPTWDPVDEHAVVAHPTVWISSDATSPRCRVQAIAADHTIVGEVSFTPVAGRQDVRIRTERAATSVQWLGCTAAGQPDAR